MVLGIVMYYSAITRPISRLLGTASACKTIYFN